MSGKKHAEESASVAPLKDPGLLLNDAIRAFEQKIGYSEVDQRAALDRELALRHSRPGPVIAATPAMIEAQRQAQRAERTAPGTGVSYIDRAAAIIASTTGWPLPKVSEAILIAVKEGALAAFDPEAPLLRVIGARVTVDYVVRHRDLLGWLSPVRADNYGLGSLLSDAEPKIAGMLESPSSPADATRIPPKGLSYWRSRIYEKIDFIDCDGKATPKQAIAKLKLLKDPRIGFIPKNTADTPDMIFWRTDDGKTELVKASTVGNALSAARKWARSCTS